MKTATYSLLAIIILFSGMTLEALILKFMWNDVFVELLNSNQMTWRQAYMISLFLTFTRLPKAFQAYQDQKNKNKKNVLRIV